MRPLDPRLLRYARSTRGFIALAVVLGVLTGHTGLPADDRDDERHERRRLVQGRVGVAHRQPAEQPQEVLADRPLQDRVAEDQRGGRWRRLHPQRFENLDHLRTLGHPHVLLGAHVQHREKAGRDFLPADRDGGAHRSSIAAAAHETFVSQGCPYRYANCLIQ